MEYQRAKYIKEELLSHMKHRIASRMADELFTVYNKEINPGRFRVQPCSCDPAVWRQMILETTVFVDRILSAWENKKGKSK
jgi:hypothetical protein